MELAINEAIQTFLKQINLHDEHLKKSQQQLDLIFKNCKGEIENISASANIPNEKLAIINDKMWKIPKLQERIDVSSKRLLEAHKAIIYLRK